MSTTNSDANSKSNLEKEALEYHKKGRPGKLEITPTTPLISSHDLSLAYSPGVATPCLEIEKKADTIYEYTSKGNIVAVISNGTAVLGLGNIGAAASKPVMEGKGLLFKIFAGIDVFDIEVDAKDPEAFISAVKAIAPTFGGINLEDIKAPEAFEIERRLKEELDIPVYGIGAGDRVDGQLVILHDLIGLFWEFKSKFVKRYCEAGELIQMALESYKSEVKGGQFPTQENFYEIKEEELDKLLGDDAWKYEKDRAESIPINHSVTPRTKKGN